MPHPTVAVFLGTDHHPYDRAVQWARTLAAAGEQEWFVQYGFTPWPTPSSATLTGSKMLGITELEDLMARADVVVTHGGPGLIMEARAARHLPIVIPRNPELGEHVDSHQMDFADRLAEEGGIRLVTTMDELREAVTATLVEGRPDLGHAGHRSDTVVRFAALVDEARTRPRTRILRRR